MQLSFSKLLIQNGKIRRLWRRCERWNYSARMPATNVSYVCALLVRGTFWEMSCIQIGITYEYVYVNVNIEQPSQQQHARAQPDCARNRMRTQNVQSHLLHCIVSGANTHNPKTLLAMLTTNTIICIGIYGRMQMKCVLQKRLVNLTISIPRMPLMRNFHLDYYRLLCRWLLSHAQFVGRLLSAFQLSSEQIAIVQNSVCKWTPSAYSSGSLQWTPNNLPFEPEVSRYSPAHLDACGFPWLHSLFLSFHKLLKSIDCIYPASQQCSNKRAVHLTQNLAGLLPNDVR